MSSADEWPATSEFYIFKTEHLKVVKRLNRKFKKLVKRYVTLREEFDVAVEHRATDKLAENGFVLSADERWALTAQINFLKARLIEIQASEACFFGILRRVATDADRGCLPDDVAEALYQLFEKK